MRARMKSNRLWMTQPWKSIHFTSAWVTSLPKVKKREHLDTLLNGKRFKVALESMTDRYAIFNK